MKACIMCCIEWDDNTIAYSAANVAIYMYQNRESDWQISENVKTESSNSYCKLHLVNWFMKTIHKNKLRCIKY